MANCILEGNSGKSQYGNLFLLLCMKENSVHHTRLIGSSINFKLLFNVNILKFCMYVQE